VRDPEAEKPMPTENQSLQSSRAAALGSDESFALLIESVKDYGIILLDPLGNVASWNPGAARLTGYQREEILGKHVSCFYPQEALDRKLPERELTEATGTGRFEDEGWRLRKDGTQFWANIVLSALKDGSGAIIGFAKLTRDLTARKQAEEKIRDLNAQLERRVQEQSVELSHGHESLRQELAEKERAKRDMAQFFELSLDMICIAGLDGYFKRLNPAWEKTLGFSTEELLAQPFVEFIHPDDVAATLAEIRKMDQGADVIRFENRYRCKDGSYRWFAWKAPAIPPGQDYLYATARDVTDRREYETRLAMLLQRLDLATHAAQLGIWDWDIVKNELLWDERMYELYGVRKEDFAGAYEAWLQGVHPEDRSHCDSAIHSAIKGEKDYDIDFRVRQPDGTLRFIKANGQIVRDEAGNPLRMTGVNYDITNLKRAGQRVALQLAASKVLAESATLTEVTPLLVQGMAEAVDAKVGAIWQVDAAANVLHCVNVWCKPGLDVADFEKMTREITFAPGIGMPGRVWQTGRPAWIPDVIVDPNFPRASVAQSVGLHAAFAAPIFRGRSFAGVLEFFTAEIHTPDAELLDVFAGIGNQIGQFIERKQAEEKLQQLSAEAVQRAAELETANKELEAFSYSVSHDLRAPLRHVQGYVELLKKATGDQLPEKAGRHLEVITDASKQMGQLIDDLLSFSRIGRADLDYITVNLDELVQLCRRGLEHETRNRRINWKIAPLPAVNGDRAMLRQVFANLMGNAVKYTEPRDPAEIEIGCAGRENGHVILFIKDNGVGFDMRFADKLFGVFQRLHTVEEFEGTGIGLANVRRIITRHGGRIWPEAAVDKGANFFFTLEEAAKPALRPVPS
jgi:PAS domain S-box-containing protein